MTEDHTTIEDSENMESSEEHDSGHDVTAGVPTPSPTIDSDLDAPYEVKKIAIDDIHVDESSNVRRRLTGISELAAGIKARGLLQPVVVRDCSDDTEHGKPYELVAGYRRCAAFKELGQESIPATIQHLDDASTLASRVVENMQREQLDPVSQAYAMQQMIDVFNWRPVDVAKALGVHRSQVTKSLKLLALPEPVLEKVAEREITRSHAEALMSLDTPEEQVEIADIAARSDMSVSKTASYVSKVRQQKEQDAMDAEKAENEAKAKGVSPKSIVKVDQTLPLEVLSPRDVTPLPYLKLKEDIESDKLMRMMLFRDLHACNDIEVEEYLDEVHGIERSDWWTWIESLDRDEVRHYIEVLMRRWFQAGSRYNRIPPRLMYQIGTPTTTKDNPIPQEPLQLEEAATGELPPLREDAEESE